MSPEQIEGKEADARSDLFALGAVFYEMLAGTRPFEGKSQISVASAILEKEPEAISRVQPLTPPAFEDLIANCLAKNPDDRYQAAHDVVLQLKWIAQGGAAVLPSAEKKDNRRELLAWLVAGAVALLLIGFVLWWRGSKVPPETTYFSAPLPFAARDVAVSPNGHTVAIVGHRDSDRSSVIWIYEPGTPDATSLPNTEGASFPFWSPDGQSIGFFADGKLKKLSLAGGPAQTLCDAPTGRGGTWGKDGVILFTPSGHLGVGLYRISASGGTPVQITVPDQSQIEDSHRWPFFLPDGIHYLYSAIHLSGRRDSSSLYLGSLGSNEKRLITKAGANASYVAPYLLFYREQTLFGQLFDSKKFELAGEALSNPDGYSILAAHFRSRIWRYKYRFTGGAKGRRLRRFSTSVVRPERPANWNRAQARHIRKYKSVPRWQSCGLGHHRSCQPEYRRLDLRSRKPECEALDLRSRD